MSEWKKLSYERSRLVHHAAMLLVAREGKAKGHLNFDGKQPLCPRDVSFGFGVSESVTGTVTIKSHGGFNWAHVVMKIETVSIWGYLSLVDDVPKPHWCFGAYSEGGIPKTIVDMALNPITMDEVLA